MTFDPEVRGTVTSIYPIVRCHSTGSDDAMRTHQLATSRKQLPKVSMFSVMGLAKLNFISRRHRSEYADFSSNVFCKKPGCQSQFSTSSVAKGVVSKIASQIGFTKMVDFSTAQIVENSKTFVLASSSMLHGFPE